MDKICINLRNHGMPRINMTNTYVILHVILVILVYFPQ